MKSWKNILTPTVILAASVAATVSANVALGSEDPAAKGYNIALEAEKRDEGFNDSRADMKMILENRHGEKAERQMRQAVLEVPGYDEGDKSLVVFDHPADVKGTAFLSYAHIQEADDQWLYLPALKRVKRISSKNKSGPFVGSEFAYEDLSAQELKKYDYKWLRDEPCPDDAGSKCFVVERYPTYERSGYTKMVAWVDQDHYRQRKIDFYDRKNELLKTLTFSDYRQYLGKYWRAHDMFMENHVTGKKTRLLTEQISFKTGLSESDMTKSRLKRVR